MRLCATRRDSWRHVPNARNEGVRGSNPRVGSPSRGCFAPALDSPEMPCISGDGRPHARFARVPGVGSRYASSSLDVGGGAAKPPYGVRGLPDQTNAIGRSSAITPRSSSNQIRSSSPWIAARARGNSIDLALHSGLIGPPRPRTMIVVPERLLETLQRVAHDLVRMRGAKPSGRH